MLVEIDTESLVLARRRAQELRSVGLFPSEIATRITAEGVPHPDGPDAQWTRIVVVRQLLEADSDRVPSGPVTEAPHARHIRRRSILISAGATIAFAAFLAVVRPGRVGR